MEKTVFTDAKNRFEQLPVRVGTVAFGVVALTAVMTGCTTENEPRPLIEMERNAPDTAFYSFAGNDAYYQDLESMQPFAPNPEAADRLEALRQTPIATWLHHPTNEVGGVVSEILESSSDTNSLPLFVAYNIPNRDLGNWSQGGAGDTDAYIEWVQTVSDAIGDHQAVVVLEPDALPQSSELSGEEKEARLSTLASALDAFHDNENTAVYLDAGVNTWLAPEETASLIQQVADKSENGVHGISLNVSNYRAEADIKEYGEQVQQALGQRLYVLADNSRNGAPEAIADEDWCNPAGQRIGSTDGKFDSTLYFETAYIKTPGQSDGECGISSKPAGEFDGDLLFEQLS